MCSKLLVTSALSLGGVARESVLQGALSLPFQIRLIPTPFTISPFCLGPPSMIDGLLNYEKG